MTRQQFAHYYRSADRSRRSLMRLGVGHYLERIELNPRRPRRLASEAELLALRPELRQTE